LRLATPETNEGKLCPEFVKVCHPDSILDISWEGRAAAARLGSLISKGDELSFPTPFDPTAALDKTKRE
jgi:hypothetical protein